MRSQGSLKVQCIGTYSEFPQRVLRVEVEVADSLFYASEIWLVLRVDDRAHGDAPQLRLDLRIAQLGTWRIDAHIGCMGRGLCCQTGRR